MTSPEPEKIISPDDDDWDWRAGAKLCNELRDRTIALVVRDGATVRGDRYDYELYIGDIFFTVGLDERRVKIIEYIDGWPHSIFATHAQVNTDWKLIQTKILPLLRSRMVLDDLAAL